MHRHGVASTVKPNGFKYLPLNREGHLLSNLFTEPFQLAEQSPYLRFGERNALRAGEEPCAARLLLLLSA